MQNNSLFAHDLSEQTLERLSRKGITVTGLYHRAHHPRGSGPSSSTSSDCRKPAPGMLRLAPPLDASAVDAVIAAVRQACAALSGQR
jgi:hypothetical protein